MKTTTNNFFKKMGVKNLFLCTLFMVSSLHCVGQNLNGTPANYGNNHYFIMNYYKQANKNAGIKMLSQYDAWTMYNSDDGGLRFSWGSNGNEPYASAGITRMLLDGGGRLRLYNYENNNYSVGICLHKNNFGGELRMIYKYINNNHKIGFADGTDSFLAYSNYNTKDFIVPYENAKVGIGTENPYAKLSLGTPVNDNLIGLYDDPQNFYGFGIRSGELMIQSAINTTFGTRSGATYSEKMRITNLGKVGIGTANPTEKLDVNGVVNATGFKINGVDINLGSSSWYQIPNPNEFNIRFMAGKVGIGVESPTEKLDVAGNIKASGIVDATGFTVNGQSLASSPWATNGDDIYYSTGNIGIGTTTPKAKLSLGTSVGDEMLAIHDGDSNTVDGFYGFGYQYKNLMIQGGSIGNITFGQRTGTTYHERVRITGDGCVGIGTTNPDSNNKLHVNGNVRIDGILDASQITFGGGQPLPISPWNTNGDDINYSTGNIGVGTTNPAEKLDVAGNIKASGTVDATGFTVNGQSLASSPWNTNGDDINYSTGNIGVGTTNPTEKLDVAGNIKASGTVDATGFKVNGVMLNSSPWTESPALIHQYKKVAIGTNNISRFQFRVYSAVQPDTPWEGAAAFGGNNRAIVLGEKDNKAHLRVLNGPLWGYQDLFINADGGNVGIGTGLNDPTEKLEVAGNIKASGTVDATGFTVNGQSLTTSPWDINGDDINYPTGKIGVGITNPTEKLEVAGNIKASGTVDATGFTVNGQSLATSPWSTNGNNINYLTGNIGVGQAQPEFALDIKPTTNGKKMLRLGSNNGNDLSFDVAAGQGLANIVAGGKFDASTNNYIYTGARGSSRIQLGDGMFGLFTGNTTTGISGQTIAYIPRFLVGNNNITLKSNQYIFNNDSNQNFMKLAEVNNVKTLDVNGVVNATGFKINGVPFEPGGSSPWTSNGNNINYATGQVEIGVDNAAAHSEYLKVHGSATFNNDLNETDLTQVSINTNVKVQGAALTVGGPTFIGSWQEAEDKATSDALHLQAASKGNLFVTKGIVTEAFEQLPNEHWKDEVFSADYNLPTLNEVAQFIEQNKHLPGILSAKEVQTDGYNLHEMNQAFLEKIENLYLYSINQEKEIKTLKEETILLQEKVKQIDDLKMILKKLETKLETLEKQK